MVARGILAIASLLAATCGAVDSSRAADGFFGMDGGAPGNWTGAYAGVNFGGGYANVSTTVSGLAGAGATSENLTGFVGGGQAGANWQTGSTVVGFECDLQGADQNHKTTNAAFAVTDTITYFGSARGRLGLGVDRWLPYVTGGWGYAGWSSTATAAGVAQASVTRSHGFWTMGGGLEVAVWHNISGKIEYLFADTGTVATSHSTAAGVVTFNSTIHDNIVRAALNYRF
jgi:outer membrane immunogenic protein